MEKEVQKNILNDHHCFCIVPLNEKGVYEIEHSQYSDFTQNMYVEDLTLSEAESVYMSVISKFNDEFDLLIGYFEEETLPNKNLDRAIEIVEEVQKTAETDLVKSASNKFLSALRKAKECGTYVELDF